eukprot:726053-Amphidinium_carterae.1
MERHRSRLLLERKAREIEVRIFRLARRKAEKVLTRPDKFLRMSQCPLYDQSTHPLKLGSFSIARSMGTLLTRLVTSEKGVLRKRGSWLRGPVLDRQGVALKQG